MSIRFEDVSKAFGTKIVLNGVSFEVHKGEILFILGKSGTGKSVTLKHIVGILKPTAGRIIIDGLDITYLPMNELSETRRKCGMVFQHPALLDSLTVSDNVAFGLRTPQYTQSISRTLSESEIQEIVIRKLALVNLGSEILTKFPPDLSYGMQKRVALARTLAPEPSYLLFDEPTTGLDPITTHAINDLIVDLSRKLQVTSVVVSHDMSSALEIADRILVLDQGKILAHASVADIKNSTVPLIQEFLAESMALPQISHGVEKPGVREIMEVPSR